MPEFPEVFTITDDLKKNILGYTIKKVAIAASYQTRPSNDEFIKKVIEQEIVNVKQLAKNIILELKSGDLIIMHLAMTGRILLRNPDEKSDLWMKVVFAVKKDSDVKQIRFCDMRMFGKVYIIDKDEFKELQNKYGPEILDPALDSQRFYALVRSKKTSIKNLLLEQKIISGVGNIYATDALFLAKINPNTQTKDITQDQSEKLFKALREVIKESISKRGSTLQDKMYVDVFGKEGEYQKYFKIYSKDKCTNCGSRVSFEKINGRGTYFCPNCQKRG